MADPHLRMCEFNLGGTLPADADAYAGVASRMVLEDITKGRLSFLVVVTFTGAIARLWQIREPPTDQVDDVVRAIAKSEGASALAFVHPTALPPEVEGADRAYNIAVECADEKLDWLVALKGGTGLGGDQFRIYKRRRADPVHRWFGVDPESEIDFWMEGPVGAVIPGGEA